MSVAPRDTRIGVSKGKKKRRGTSGVQGVHPSNGGNPQPLRRPSSFSDLFGGGENGNLIHPDYDRKEVYAWFQRRHAKGRTLIDDDGFYRRDDHEWKVPYGVRLAFKTPLVYNQIIVRYPFYATWISPKTGNRLKKNFSTLIGAIHFCATKAQYVDPRCSVVAKVVGYHCPPKLRGMFPRRMGGKRVYWCPYCMDARSYRRAYPLIEFTAIKKEWSDEKQRYVWKERKLARLTCTVCGNSNQDQKFRHNNQPYELRKIKKGVRRIRKTKRRK